MTAQHWRTFIFHFSASSISQPSSLLPSGLGQNIAKSVSGPPLPTGALLFLGAVAGAITGCDAQARGEPFLYLLAPAWFFQVFLQVWKLLRYPRTHSWPFALGLSYEQRRSLSSALLMRTIAEFCLLALAAVATFTICQSIALRRLAWEKLAGGFLLFTIEALSCSLSLYCTLQWKLITPIKSDRLEPFFSAFRPGVPSMTSLLRLSDFIARKLLPSGAAELAQRQMIYLIRMDIFSLVVFPPLALIIVASILFYVKGGYALVGDAAALIAPLMLMIDRTPVFDESVLKLRSCSYYAAPASDLLLVNACFSALACFPFAVLFLAAGIFVHGANLSGPMVHAVAFLTGMTGMAMVMAYRWLLPAWTSTSSSMTVTTLLCAVLGCAIPRFGIIFPLFSIVMIFFLLRNQGLKTGPVAQ
jgi:hypothetical protein